MLISDSDLFEVEYANIHKYIRIYADIFEVEYAPNPNVYESAVQEWPTLLQTLANVKQKIEEVRRKCDRNYRRSKRTP